VIEFGRGPAAGVMTRAALDHSFRALELAGVNIFVTARATLRRGLERDLAQARSGGRFRIRRPMTIQAAQHAVPPCQRERCRLMVEILQLAPRTQAMARFANALARFEVRLRDFRELALMRILVAALASPVGEVILAVRARRCGRPKTTCVSGSRRAKASYFLLFVVLARNSTRALRSSADPIVCSGILVPGV